MVTILGAILVVQSISCIILWLMLRSMGKQNEVISNMPLPKGLPQKHTTPDGTVVNRAMRRG